MLSAFLHGYLLSCGLILLLGPQNELVFSQRATPPKLCRALLAVLTEEVAQAGAGGDHLDQRGVSGVQSDSDVKREE